MNTTLWIIQGILAVAFAMAGLLKTTQPIDKLAKTVTWANRFPVTVVRFIGVSEFLGALGLILPGVLNMIPIMTPIAASGLALIMWLAIFHHSRHKEGKAVVFNVVLLIMAAIVGYNRFEML
jgi:uncharacterized membrane protein YphA (DoxX/SURF4 family)